MGLPGSHRRRSSALSRRRRASSLPSLVEEGADGGSQWIKNSLSIVGVCVVGAAGWAIAWKTGVWAPTPLRDGGDGDEVALGAQILGYASAICYLGARIPQIIKNQKEQSCEGLSLLFFMLSLLGNATYGAGVSHTFQNCSTRSLTKLDPFPFRRERILPHQPPLADRLARHHGRGRDHLHPVPRFWQRRADFCRCYRVVISSCSRKTFCITI
jgi:hypothetical protein